MTDKVDQLVEFIKNKTKMSNYKIKIDVKGEKPTIFDSKVGGLPYWTKDKTYPENSDGKKLLLLAQINFDKWDVDDPLPKQGLLQFFIYCDDLMGLDFDNQDEQNSYRVVYHETIDYTITEESIKEAKIPNSLDCSECFPVCGEYKITLNQSEDFMSTYDFRFDDLFLEAYKEVYGKEPPENEKFYFKLLTEEESDKLCNKLESNDQHKMLGYPYFTQEDPRNDPKLNDYDTLLFQLDSEGEYVVWGDAGVCNFFIKKDELLKKDFSKVLYNWDCC